MKQKITEFFLYMSVSFLNIAKRIDPSLTNKLIAYLCEQFLKNNVGEIEIELDNKKETIIVTEIKLSKLKDGDVL